MPTAPEEDAATETPRAGGRDQTQVIYRMLREEIISGDLGAGTWISQVQAAERFGVSRGPVREAMRLLEREGLISAAFNHRSRVADMSASDLEQLYAARIVNEALSIAASVPAFSDDDLAEITEMADQLQDLAGTDMTVWEPLHRRFHAKLVQHAGDQLLQIVSQLYDHSERYRRASIAVDPRAWALSSSDHPRIAEACATRDPQAAAAELARHLTRTALLALALLAPEHEPKLVRTALSQVTASSTV